MPLFAPDQLADHVSRAARLWHLARKGLGVGWRTMQAQAVVVGILMDGETDPDGDTTFNLVVPMNLNVHCEVDPADLAMLRPILLQLDAGMKLRVSGVCCCDLGHGCLEIHPVTAIEVI